MLTGLKPWEKGVLKPLGRLEEQCWSWGPEAGLWNPITMGKDNRQSPCPGSMMRERPRAVAYLTKSNVCIQGGRTQTAARGYLLGRALPVMYDKTITGLDLVGTAGEYSSTRNYLEVFISRRGKNYSWLWRHPRKCSDLGFISVLKPPVCNPFGGMRKVCFCILMSYKKLGCYFVDRDISMK